jgi:hypothetical protein
MIDRKMLGEAHKHKTLKQTRLTTFEAACSHCHTWGRHDGDSCCPLTTLEYPFACTAHLTRKKKEVQSITILHPTTGRLASNPPTTISVAGPVVNAFKGRSHYMQI